MAESQVLRHKRETGSDESPDTLNWHSTLILPINYMYSELSQLMKSVP